MPASLQGTVADSLHPVIIVPQFYPFRKGETHGLLICISGADDRSVFHRRVHDPVCPSAAGHFLSHRIGKCPSRMDMTASFHLLRRLRPEEVVPFLFDVRKCEGVPVMMGLLLQELFPVIKCNGILVIDGSEHGINVHIFCYAFRLLAPSLKLVVIHHIRFFRRRCRRMHFFPVLHLLLFEQRTVFVEKTHRKHLSPRFKNRLGSGVPLDAVKRTAPPGKCILVFFIRRLLRPRLRLCRTAIGHTFHTQESVVLMKVHDQILLRHFLINRLHHQIICHLRKVRGPAGKHSLMMLRLAFLRRNFRGTRRLPFRHKRSLQYVAVLILKYDDIFLFGILFYSHDSSLFFNEMYCLSQYNPKKSFRQ